MSNFSAVTLRSPRHDPSDPLLSSADSAVDHREAKEFYEVNSNAKPVKVDLVFQLLSKMAENDPETQRAARSRRQGRRPSVFVNFCGHCW